MTITEFIGMVISILDSLGLLIPIQGMVALMVAVSLYRSFTDR